MAHKYTYPVIDRALRDFLMFVLMLLTVVAVAMAIGTVSGVDTAAINAQTMGFPSDTVQPLVPPQAQEHIDEHVRTIWTQGFYEDEPTSLDVNEGEYILEQ